MFRIAVGTSNLIIAMIAAMIEILYVRVVDGQTDRRTNGRNEKKMRLREVTV